MHGEAYPRVDLNDVDGLECLVWAVYDGVFLPGNPPALTGHHDWQWIIVGTILRLVYWGATAGAHCPHAQSPHTTLSRGDPPALTGHHDWQWIIVGTILRLVYWGATAGAHCPHAQSPHTTLSRPLSGKVPHGTLGGSSPRLHGHLLC